MNILVFKLKSGIDIISEVEDNTLKYYKLNNPYQIVPIDTFDDDGMPRSTMIILNQWLMFSTEQFVNVTKNDILVVYKPNKFLLSMYIARRVEDETNPPKTGFTKGGSKKSKPPNPDDFFKDGKEDNKQNDFGNLDDDEDDGTFEERGDDPFFNDGPKS
jgi:hypothetical protein